MIRIQIPTANATIIIIPSDVTRNVVIVVNDEVISDTESADLAVLDRAVHDAHDRRVAARSAGLPKWKGEGG